MAWQKATGYGRRSLVETAIGRYKHIIGSTLRGRSKYPSGGGRLGSEQLVSLSSDLTVWLR
jgi:hypothetical protein